MEFIDKNDIIKDIKEGQFIDRKVICELCSTVQEGFYVDKVTMNFNHHNNLYTCPKCGYKVSGAYIEKIIYFQNKEFIYESNDDNKNQLKKRMKFAGYVEGEEPPEVEVTTLE